MPTAALEEVSRKLQELTSAFGGEHATAAAHIRGLIFGEGDLVDRAFLSHYRSLLQLDHALASTYGNMQASESTPLRLATEALEAERKRRKFRT